MKKLAVQLSSEAKKDYEILIGSDLSHQIVSFVKKQSVSQIVIITDNTVKKLYGDRLLQELQTNIKSLIFSLLSFKSGEQSKIQKTVTELQNQMFERKCGRDTLIIALGGGVVGDMAGYVAATYMRGIPYIQIPTTLLSMVDSSVGGKTGIDSKYGKNLIGAFWQPSAVFIDFNYLETLPKRQLMNGLVEAVKMFITHNKEMFEFVEANLNSIIKKDKKILEKIIFEAVKIKSGVVMRDELETGERKVLNFGHTIGHAIEKLSNYKILHGEAVAMGIIVESKISELMGILAKEDFERIKKLILKLGINLKVLRKFKIKDIIRTTGVDKKNVDGKVKYVLLEKIGKAYLKDKHWAQRVVDKFLVKSIQL